MSQPGARTHSLSSILDVMRVTPSGDPLAAVIAVDHTAEAVDVECDVLVVGGGLGGVAAAWAAARHGRSVCLLEETDWLGGQATSQGVSALDEHEHIERFGGTRTYYRLREAIRDQYRRLIPEADRHEPLNPGSCWVTRLAFEPSAALRALDELLAPEIESGRLRVFMRTRAVETVVDRGRVVSLKAVNLDDGSAVRFRLRLRAGRHRAWRPPAADRRRVHGRGGERPRDGRAARPAWGAEGPLRPELHLHLHDGAPSPGRRQHHPGAGPVRPLPRRAALQPPHPRPRRRDIRGGVGMAGVRPLR